MTILIILLILIVLLICIHVYIHTETVVQPGEGSFAGKSFEGTCLGRSALQTGHARR